jgi:DNA-3-methyladenine glycosylase II
VAKMIIGVLRQGRVETISFVTMSIGYQPPLDWAFLLAYGQRRQTGGVEAFTKGRYMRTVDVGGDTGVITVDHDPGHQRLLVGMDGQLAIHRPVIERRVRRMFDLNTDLAAVQIVLAKDPLLGQLVDQFPGTRVPGGWCAFELLVRTIVGQQVSVEAATTIMGRIVAKYGRPLPRSDQTLGIETPMLFPAPETLATADLSDVGLMSRRQAAVKNVAGLFASGQLQPICGTLSVQDVDDIKAVLLQQPGIGPWTVEYFSLRALRDPDAWPGTDLVLRRALKKHPLAGLEKLKAITERWKPYRGYAAVLLWQAS